MNKPVTQDRLRELFKLNSAYDTLYFTSDGHLFLKYATAQGHSKFLEEDRAITTYHRKDVPVFDPLDVLDAE